MTAKLILDIRYKRKDHLYPIAISVRSGEQHLRPKTGHYIPKSAWNTKTNEVKMNYADADIINADIAKQLATVKSKLVKAQADGVTDLDIILSDKQLEKPMLFSDYLIARAGHYDEMKKIKHANKVRAMLLNLQECLNKKKMPAGITELQKKELLSKGEVPYELTAEDMRTLHAHLKNIGNKPNTIHKKFQLLGNFFNNAIKEKKTTAENVFEQIEIPTKKVKKDKLTLEELATLEQLTLPEGVINDSRNLFLFSYYCKGMRFEDCVRFKKGKIVNDRAVFEDIRKGHKEITVQIHSRLRILIQQYINSNTPYLFPFLKNELLIDKTGKLTKESEEERITKVESQNVIVNRNLALIMEAAGIKKKIRMHNSRHSFAKHMKDKKKAVSVISQALGHSSERVTQVYLDSLDDEIIDEDVNDIYES